MMISFLIVLSVAAAVGNLGMMAFWYSRVRRLKGKPEPQGVCGLPGAVNFADGYFRRCEYQELKPGHCYLFILRGHWRFVGCVQDVGKDGCFRVQVPSPAEEFRAAFSMGKYWSEAKINWYRDVTGCEEVTV